MLIQFFISFFVLFAISRIAIRFRKRELDVLKFLIWFIFWLAAGMIVWIPNVTTQVANFLGIGRGADLIFYISILVLFYLIFRIYIKLEKMDRNITKIVRKDALDKK